MPDDAIVTEIRKAAEDLLDKATQANPVQLTNLIPGILSHLAAGEAGIQGLDARIIYGALKDASKDPSSRISSKRGRGGGYFLKEDADPGEITGAEPAPSMAPAQPTAAFQEKHLWPVVEFWLKEEKEIRNSSSSVANLKSGGVWSNPDVVGLLPSDDLGFSMWRL